MSTTMTMTAVAPKAGRREWIGLVAIALPCLVYAMDLTVLNLALPQLSADLSPSSTELLWIVDIYGFFVAGSLITMGTIGDRIGRRRLLMIGAAAFGAVSVLAAFSTSAGMLIVSRALLGVAGATLAPSTLSLIRNMFLDDHERTVAIGVWVASFSAGAALGPVVGGVLLEHYWWGSAFLVSVPVMVLLLVVGPRLLPEFRDENAGRLDLPSAGLSLVAVLAMIYGLKHVAQEGFDTTAAVATLTGLGLGLVFVRRQRTLADPLIDLDLFRDRAFNAALTANAFSIFAAAGVFLFIAQYFQLVRGLSPLQAGLWGLPWSGALVIGSMAGPKLAQRWRPGQLVGGGLAVAAAGCAVLTQVDAGSGLPILILGSVVVASGLSIVIPMTTEMVVGAAPPERAGAASAISETSLELGGALGIAFLGSIGTAVYRSGVDGDIPADLPAGSADAARESLGGAVASSAELPGQAGAALLDAARDAFTQGMRLSAAISFVAAVGVALLVRSLLREPGSSPEADVDIEIGVPVEVGVGAEVLACCP